MIRKSIVLGVFLSIITSMNAQEIMLPEPQKKGGKPFMETLADRKSNREFSEQELSPQQLSDLLWAANGMNRQDGKRTAPSARNMQQIDIYLFTEKGIFLYEPKRHVLKSVKEGDYRADAATAEFAKKSPLLLVFVANYDKMGNNLPEDARDLYAATDCGNVSQNVYLFCSSENLNTVAIGSINRDQIKKLIDFNGKAILGQPVGLPR